MPKNEITYGSYIESPLGQFIVKAKPYLELLNKLPAPKIKSKEEIRAREIVTVLKKVMNDLPSLLKTFDNGNKPWVSTIAYDFVTTILPMKNYVVECFITSAGKFFENCDKKVVQAAIEDTKRQLLKRKDLTYPELLKINLRAKLSSQTTSVKIKNEVILDELLTVILAEVREEDSAEWIVGHAKRYFQVDMSRSADLWNIDVDHPISYLAVSKLLNLIKEMTETVDNVPGSQPKRVSLKTIIGSFFNPAILTADYSKLGFKIKHNPNEKGYYSCEITTRDEENKKDRVETISIDDFYVAILLILTSRMQSSLKTYEFKVAQTVVINRINEIENNKTLSDEQKFEKLNQLSLDYDEVPIKQLATDRKSHAFLAEVNSCYELAFLNKSMLEIDRYDNPSASMLTHINDACERYQKPEIVISQENKPVESSSTITSEQSFEEEVAVIHFNDRIAKEEVNMPIEIQATKPVNTLEMQDIELSKNKFFDYANKSAKLFEYAIPVENIAGANHFYQHLVSLTDEQAGAVAIAINAHLQAISLQQINNDLAQLQQDQKNLFDTENVSMESLIAHQERLMFVGQQIVRQVEKLAVAKSDEEINAQTFKFKEIAEETILRVNYVIEILESFENADTLIKQIQALTKLEALATDLNATFLGSVLTVVQARRNLLQSIKQELKSIGTNNEFESIPLQTIEDNIQLLDDESKDLLTQASKRLANNKSILELRQKITDDLANVSILTTDSLEVQAQERDKITAIKEQYNQLENALKLLDPNAVVETTELTTKETELLKNVEDNVKALQAVDYFADFSNDILIQEIHISSLLRGNKNDVNAHLKGSLEHSQILLDEVARIEAISKAFSARKSIRSNYLDSLTRYITERNDNTAYAFKDVFFSHDIKIRKEFINDITSLLNDYLVNPAKADEIKAKALQCFPGVKLQPLLNRLYSDLVVVKELEDGELQDWIKNSLDKKPAQPVLKAFKDELDEMKLYAEDADTDMPENDKEVVLKLHKRLSDKLGAFITDNWDSLINGKTISAEKIDTFKKEFKILAHSQDDNMGNHRGMKKILSNLFAALFTAGLALLGVAAYTKFGEQQHATLFANKTQRQQNVDMLGQALDVLDTLAEAPAAVGM